MTTVEIVTDEEISDLVACLVDSLGTTVDALRSEAVEGVFSSEAHRRAWYSIAAVGHG